MSFFGCAKICESHACDVSFESALSFGTSLTDRERSFASYSYCRSLRAKHAQPLSPWNPVVTMRCKFTSAALIDACTLITQTCSLFTSPGPCSVSLNHHGQMIFACGLERMPAFFWVRRGMHSFDTPSLHIFSPTRFLRGFLLAPWFFRLQLSIDRVQHSACSSPPAQHSVVDQGNTFFPTVGIYRQSEKRSVNKYNYELSMYVLDFRALVETNNSTRGAAFKLAFSINRKSRIPPAIIWCSTPSCSSSVRHPLMFTPRLQLHVRSSFNFALF